MSGKSYTNLKAILIGKLRALTYGSQTLFSEVYGVEETQPKGYPCAFVIERTGSGQLLDTHRNEREWQFSVVIHQEIGQKTPETAYAALLTAVDSVITMFDQDPLLLDDSTPPVAQCMRTKVVPVDFEYAKRESPVHRALLVVGISDIVNRYA